MDKATSLAQSAGLQAAPLRLPRDAVPRMSRSLCIYAHSAHRATASAASVLSSEVGVFNGKSVRLHPGTTRSYVHSCDVLGAVVWRSRGRVGPQRAGYPARGGPTRP